MQRLFRGPLIGKKSWLSPSTWWTWGHVEENLPKSKNGLKILVGELISYPRCSMYGLFTYIWVVLVVNVGNIYHTLSIWVCGGLKNVWNIYTNLGFHDFKRVAQPSNL